MAKASKDDRIEEVIGFLKLTGTGEQKLDYIKSYLQRTNESDDPMALVAARHLEEENLFPGTVKKLQEMAGGSDPMDKKYQGVPPPDSKLRERQDLAILFGNEVRNAIDEKLQAGLALGVGDPKRIQESKPKARE